MFVPFDAPTAKPTAGNGLLKFEELTPQPLWHSTWSGVIPLIPWTDMPYPGGVPAMPVRGFPVAASIGTDAVQ